MTVSAAGRNWCWVYPRPHPDDYYAVWESSPTDVWVIGQNILHYDGATWTRTFDVPWPPTGYGGIWGTAPSDLWATSARALLHWDGSTWAVTATAPHDANSEFTGIWGSSSRDIWVSELSGWILHWTGGPDWETAFAPKRTERIHDISGSAPDNVWAVGAGFFSVPYGTSLHWNGRDWEDCFAYDGGLGPFKDCPRQVVSLAVLGVNDVWLGGNGASHWDGTSTTRQFDDVARVRPFFVRNVGFSQLDIHGQALGERNLDRDLPPLAAAHDPKFWPRDGERRSVGGRHQRNPQVERSIMDERFIVAQRGTLRRCPRNLAERCLGHRRSTYAAR